MTAKEMFEELGYTYRENMFFIEYQKSDEEYFTFYKLSKMINIGDDLITIDESKAINKQCEELG